MRCPLGHLHKCGDPDWPSCVSGYHWCIQCSDYFKGEGVSSTYMSLTDKLLSADTRDILSLGTLLILGWGVYTNYFPAEVVAPMIAMVLSFWFSQKSNHPV